MKLTERGKVQGGKIVLPGPLKLPDGTRIVVHIEFAAVPPAPARPGATGTPRNRKPRELSRDELREFVQQHPAPQAWWDATDDPFSPEDKPAK